MRREHCRRALLPFLFLAVGFVQAAKSADVPVALWPHEQSDLPASARVTWGHLDNGLRYAIMPAQNTSPVVSLRLLVLAGSLHEADDEIGYAHFVEHMAFKSTRRFGSGELVKALQNIGVSFGPHVNAYTGYKSTVYKLELPDSSDDHVRLGVRVLREFADGAVFDPGEVKRERGVVLSEAYSRENSDKVWSDALNAFLYAGTRIPLRPPIGNPKAIRKTDTKRVRAFYDAWYRPERMVVVATGAIDAKTMAALIRENFSTLQAQSPARREPALGSLTTRDGVVKVHASPRAGVEFDLFSLRQTPQLHDSAEARRQEYTLGIAHFMLHERFRRRLHESNSPISNFSVKEDRVFDEIQRLTLTVVGNVERWQLALKTLEQELRRSLQYGFDASELELSKAAARSAIIAAAVEALTQPSDVLADGLVGAIESNRVFNLADEDRDLKLAALERITPKDCSEAWREAWGPVQGILFVGVDPEFQRTFRDVPSALAASRAEPVAPPKPVEAVTFGYTDFGPPGAVVEKNYIPDLEVWQLRFANHVRFNFKATPYEKSMVHFRVRVAGGRSIEPQNAPGLAVWAGAGWLYGGLGRHGIDDVQQALNGSHGAFSAAASDDAMLYSGKSPAPSIEFVLNVAAAYFTDPAFRNEAREKIKPFINSMYTDVGRSAAGAIQRAVLPTLAGRDPRIGLPDYSKLAGQTMPQLGDWLKPALNSAYLEISMVGDIPLERAIELVAKTFGALPVRASEPSLDVTPLKNLPSPPLNRRYAFPTIAEHLTLVALYWPTRDATSTTSKRQLQLLAQILEDRIRVKVREEMGATYSPRAGLLRTDAYPEFSYLRCELSVQRRSAHRLANIVAELARDLGRDGVTAEELERARAQAIGKATRAQQSNAYWIDEVLSDAQQRPFRLNDARTAISDISGFTRAQVDAQAAKYLSSANLFKFVIEPE
jgi:zinc protease